MEERSLSPIRRTDTFLQDDVFVLILVFLLPELLGLLSTQFADRFRFQKSG